MRALHSSPLEVMEKDKMTLLERHKVDTVLLTCMDFRFRDSRQRAAFSEAVFKAFGVEDFDEIRLAGGAKNISSPDKPGRLETALDDLRLAVEKHHARRIVLITHQNCGKYAADGYVFTGSETERVFHERELRLAGNIVFRHFPEGEILLGYALVGDGDIIRVEPVKHSTAS